MKRLFTLLLFFICLGVWNASGLYAQTTGGSVSGTLADSTGAPRPNVTVTLENVTTGQRLTATTDTTGLYRFTDVPAGRYRVLSGTTTASTSPAQEITVDLGRPATVNLTMGTGPSTDSFMTAETVPTSQTPASIQNTYNGRMVQYLPQPNFIARDGSAYGAYNLGLLSEATVSTVQGNRGPAVGGQPPIANNYHVDGFDNNNKVNPGPLVYVSNEATTDFSLFQNQPSPNFGHSSGGKFNSLVRNGSNGVHGSIYDYLQNRNLNAMDQQLKRLGFTENPGYDLNRLGASLGMPIIPSKLFFFGNFEYIPLRTSMPYNGIAYAPTAAGFQALRGISGVTATNLGILQNAVGSSVGPAVRTTTVNGVTIPLGQVVSASPVNMTQYMGTGALDFTPWEKDRFSFRYVHNESDTNNAFGGLPSFTTGLRNKSLLASGAYYHTFFNAVTNELRFGFNRFTQWSPTNPNINSPGLTAFPNLQIGEQANLILGQQFGLSQGATFNTYHLADGLSIRVASHQIRFGFDGRRYQGVYNNFASNFGNYSYSSLGRFLADLPPDVASSRSFLNGSFSPNQYLLNGYIMDTWSIRPSFSLDLGLRYEYATIPTGIANQRLNSIANVPGLIEFNEPRSQTNNLAPFIGFAASPFHNWFVLRGGAGVYYDTLYEYQYPALLGPQFGATAFGNLNSTTPGFLAGGGIRNPNPTGANLTAAQARAQTTNWTGNQRTPYTIQWNVAVEQQIWRNFTGEVKYLGARGRHLPAWTMLNNPGIVTATNSLPLYTTAPAQAQLNALPLTLTQLQNMQSTNPYIQAGFTNPLTTIAPDANSWYHALALSLNHRFTGGFQFAGNYTWSHTIDDATGTPYDLAFPTRVRGNSLYDQRHNASATMMWEVAPLFRNSYSILRNVFADFTLAGTYNYGTGQTLPISSMANAGLANTSMSGVLFNNGGLAGTGSGVTPLRNSAGQVVAYQVTNPNAQFIRGAAGLYIPGNRYGIQLQDTNNFNVSAVKRFNFADKASIEFRGDAYNLLNRSQFTGSSTTNLGYRYLNAVPGFLIPGSVDFGNYQANLPSNSRTLQVGARIVF
jgi:hypothetical protein